MGKCIEGGAIAEGRWYWVRDAASKNGIEHGLVVMMTWMSSKRRYHTPYVHFFNEIGWECLVCEPHYLNLWLPSRATALAITILDKLTEELNKRPRPVCFASFSGGTKACTYIILQILKGKCEGVDCDPEKYRIVKKCAAGFLFDSTPVDFESRVGVRFFRQMLGNNIVIRMSTEATAKALDFLFQTKFDAQALQLYNSFLAAAEMAPVIFLCAENDKLAPIEPIRYFFSDLQTRGFTNVTLVVWDKSDHVAHLRNHTNEYKQAVANFFQQAQSYHTAAAAGYSQQQFPIGEEGNSPPSSSSPPPSSPPPSAPPSSAAAATTVSSAAPAALLVKLSDVADMIADDVYDLQHDLKADMFNRKILLTFPPVRSRL